MALAAQGLPWPECGAAKACREVHFDVGTGACVETPLADGVACQSACLDDARCLRGECVGAAKRCDDGDACTADRCDAQAGCVHDDVAAACPASVDPCRVAVCRSATGCDFDAAPDGTACGPNDCTTAHVCIAGRCEARAAPEGSQCAPAGVCQAPATCRASACVPGEVTYPREVWRHAPRERRLSFDGTVDPSGTAYFTEAPTLDASGALELVALDASGRVRWRVELARPCRGCRARLMLDPPHDTVLVGRQGLVEARTMSSGRLLWTRDTRVGKALRWSRGCRAPPPRERPRAGAGWRC